MPTAPTIRYVRRADGLALAYWKLGRGPVLLHSPNVQLGHARSEWSVEGMRRWYQGLARSFTVVRYDHRGGGLSSRGHGPQSIDALVQDIELIVGAVASGPVALLGWITGGLPAIAYAARHPGSVSNLVLYNSFAGDAAHGQKPRMSSLFRMAATDWEMFTESICQAALGWRDAEEARRWAAVARDATTQAEFLAFLEARRAWDVTPELGEVRAPTLVVYDPSNALAHEERSRELAARIPGARLLVGGDEGNPVDDGTLATIRAFVGPRLGDAGGLERLTPREREVLGQVARGATNAEIAERLSISLNTVTRHLTHIYTKTGTKRRAEAVRYALERGLGGA